MTVTAFKRTCMRDRIREVLVTRILDGTYPAGTQLKELPLAREFNVSQAPIREALRELEGTGLVASERYRGTHVRGADFEEMRASYELRAMIEARSIQRALPLSEEVLRRLEQLLGTMTAAAGRRDAVDYLDAVLQFHRGLVEAGGNATFLKTWDGLFWEVRGRIILERRIARGEELMPLLDMYGELIERLREGDAAGATALVEGKLTQVAEVLVQG